MPKHLVMIARLTVDGTERAEIGNFLVDTCMKSLGDPELKPLIEDIHYLPLSQVPTDVARNKLVKLARKYNTDYLVMVDDDAAPPLNWFKNAFLFLVKHHGPALVGCPYVCGGEEQRVQVFDWASPHNHAEPAFALRQIPREDAARRQGIQEVANIGTHTVMYDMRCFDRIDPPYYAYELNEDATAVLSTEEVYCHRRLHLAGVKLYVDWDNWSDHIKPERWTKPYVLTKKEIDKVYLAQAREELRGDERCACGSTAGC